MRRFWLVLCLTVTGRPVAAREYLIRADGSGDLPTIQAALVVAADEDTVSLADGVFCGSENHNLDFQGKRITLRSLSGDPEQCVIDCDSRPGDTGSLQRGIWFHSGEGPDSRVQDIWIRNGRAAET